MLISNSAINKVGDIIRQGERDARYDDTIATLNEWREAHGAIMDKYYNRCVRIARKIDPRNNIIAAQRLKRLPTIINKLDRFKTMRLSSMHDIAGVRIIVENMSQLREVEKRLRRWKYLFDVDDYIARPKPSGYRGKHFIIKENGSFVEIQLRTQLQHLWATSVETTDVFRGSAMKTEGDDTYWRDFFCQVSSIFAIRERAPVLSEHAEYSVRELYDRLERTISEHHIYRSIDSMLITNLAVQKNRIQDAYYVVLKLDFEQKQCDMCSFKESDYESAFEKYHEIERGLTPGTSAVLVSVSDVKKLRTAYPNYFVNLEDFVRIIKFMLETNRKKS